MVCRISFYFEFLVTRVKPTHLHNIFLMFLYSTHQSLFFDTRINRCPKIKSDPPSWANSHRKLFSRPKKCVVTYQFWFEVSFLCQILCQKLTFFLPDCLGIKTVFFVLLALSNTLVGAIGSVAVNYYRKSFFF